jgi:subtilisin family serine protease
MSFSHQPILAWDIKMKKYIITLNDIKDKEEFCDQMDKSLFDLSKGFVPQRSCDCVAKGPMSRNTTYILSEDEAANLKKDVRIKNVELSFEQIPGFKIGPAIFNPPEYDIVGQNNDNDIQDDFQTQAVGDKYATISNVPNGIDVDVVIVDDYVEANHPEFAKNPNGTGGSRVNRINWNIYDNEVLGYISGDTYDYTIDNTESHGTHTAGTTAGNTQGWAKKANIYHMRFNTSYWAQYIRAFHRNKPLKSNGTKNPTVVNNSWGYFYDLQDQSINNIVSVTYRGVTTNKPSGGWNAVNDLLSKGILSLTNGKLYIYNNFISSVNADVDDMVSEGTIVVASAGNTYSKCDAAGGIDYNNYFTLNYNGDPANQFAYYYNRPTSPAASDSAISVGSIKSLKISGLEYKAQYSNCGPTVDVYAPGDAIISSVLITAPNSIADSRNSGYGLSKFTGTSMAGPQVTGMLACIASTNPSFDQTAAKSYISTNAKNTIADTGGGANDFKSLQGSPNKYLYYAGSSVTYP